MDNKSGWKTVVAVVAIIAVMFVIFLYLKDCELYIGGVILQNVRAGAGLIIEIPMLILALILNVNSLKKISDENQQKKAKRSIVGLSIVTLLILGFTCWVISEDVERSAKSAIAEEDIGGGQELLLVENEEKFSSDGESFYEISIYCREGLRLKKIGRQTEYYYLHDNMIRNGQYKVERKGDTVTVYYDYGELINGLTWKDEYKDNPPEYIDKKYSLK